MIDAVVFDLDDTICTYRRHGSEVLADAFDHVGAEPIFGIEDYYAVYEEYAGVAETVEAQREACFAALAEVAGEAPDLGRAIARAFAADRDHRDVRFQDGAEAALAALGEAYPLALVTNGAPGMQAKKLEALGLADVFETVVHGGHDAPAKPSPEPFYLAIDALSVEPNRAVYVGNSLETDVAGAEAAGLRSAWLTNGPGTDPGEHEPDYVLSSPSELVDPPWTTTT